MCATAAANSGTVSARGAPPQLALKLRPALGEALGRQRPEPHAQNPVECHMHDNGLLARIAPSKELDPLRDVRLATVRGELLQVNPVGSRPRRRSGFESALEGSV
jgi:hypothetical protein